MANRQRLPREDVRLDVEGTRLMLTVRQVRRARDKARATGMPHNEARVTFVKTLLRELTEQLREHIEEAGAGNNADRSYLAEDVRSVPRRARHAEPVLDAHDAPKSWSMTCSASRKFLRP